MAATALDIVDEPNQEFRVTLTDEDFIINLTFNKLDSRWRMKLSRLDGTDVFTGRVVLLGVDLLAGTNVPGILLPTDTSDQGIEADFDGLVSGRVQLIYADIL